MVDNFSLKGMVGPDSAIAPALVQEKPRKGIDRLFKDDKKDKNEGGKVTVEE